MDGVGTFTDSIPSYLLTNNHNFKKDSKTNTNTLKTATKTNAMNNLIISKIIILCS